MLKNTQRMVTDLERALAPGPTPEEEEILDSIVLESFVASPRTIKAFGASRLNWAVNGPAGEFTVELDSRQVETSGTRFVRPRWTRTYPLRARVGAFRRLLGGATVTVDLDACEPRVFDRVGQVLEAFLKETVKKDPELRFRPSKFVGGKAVPSEPLVEIDETGIRFKLALRASVEGAPDPYVDVDARFTLTVSDHKIVSSIQWVKVAITWPWFAWLLPGAVIGLPIATGFAEQKAEATMRENIEDFPKGVEAWLWRPDDRLQLHSVRIVPDIDGYDTIEGLFCPDPLLLEVLEGVDSESVAAAAEEGRRGTAKQ